LPRELFEDFNALGAQTPLILSDNSPVEFVLRITNAETAHSMLVSLLPSLFLQSAQTTVLETDYASTFPLADKSKHLNKELSSSKEPMKKVKKLLKSTPVMTRT
jgi:hypothetical protein